MTSGGSSFVYTAEPDPKGGEGLVATVKPIQLGNEFDEGFEIISGLNEGDKVITLGLMSQGARLRPGARVVVDQQNEEEVAARNSVPSAANGSEASGQTMTDHQAKETTAEGSKTSELTVQDSFHKGSGTGPDHATIPQASGQAEVD
jgi:hypothetical protein